MSISLRLYWTLLAVNEGSQQIPVFRVEVSSIIFLLSRIGPCRQKEVKASTNQLRCAVQQMLLDTCQADSSSLSQAQIVSSLPTEHEGSLPADNSLPFVPLLIQMNSI
jgi:hypothetical protein